MKTFLTLLVTVSIGCASKAENKTERNTDSQSQQKKSAVVNCSSSANSLKYETYSGEKVGLCESMKLTNHKAVAIFITHPTCIGCRPKLKKIAKYISNHQDIKLITAIPSLGSEDQNTIQENQDFVEEYAPNSEVVRDSNKSLWTYVDRSSQPVFPVLIVVGENSTKYETFTSDILENDFNYTSFIYPSMLRAAGSDLPSISSSNDSSSN